MVCKEDVISWFKELESYKRIDTMCTLLNMCLPFELRFIGTYLEDLGKRDFQELRGAELRANNPADLAADIGGANTDPRTRRKMALYVSLLRSCNYVCATTLYNVMVGLEQTGLLNGLYGDPLEELLLLYTMALHHPAFTFDHRSHFGEILDKLKLEDQRNNYSNQSIPPHSIQSSSSCLTHTNVTPNLPIPHPSVAGLGPPQNILYMKTPQLPVSGLGPDILTDGNSLLTDMTAPPGIITHYSMPDYVGQNIWTTTSIIPTTMNQPLEVINYPPQPSPIMSPLGSPSRSRASSPTLPMPPVTTPSVPLIAPPPARTVSQAPTPTMLAHNMNATLTISEMRHMDDDRLRELGIPPNAVTQLRSVEKLNGLRRVGGIVGNSQCCPMPRPQHSSGSDSSAPASPPTPHAPPAPTITRATLPYAHFPPFAACHPHPPFTNGEPGPPVPQVYSTPPPIVPPKLSCWNCGGCGHAGHECREPSIEEMTRAGGYQLDFSAAPPDTDDK